MATVRNPTGSKGRLRRVAELARSGLGHPRIPLLAIAAAILLCVPCLFSGFIADDHIHRIRLSPDLSFPGFDHSWVDLFVFSSADPTQRRILQEEGLFGWWAAEDHRLAFWRPLSALTHLLDERLWPGSSILAHVQSLLFFALLLAVVALLYRRVHTVATANLALLLYALDDARGMVLSFVANRNALVAAALALASLLAYDRGRRASGARGARAAAILGPALFLASLTAGESALAVLGYFAAHALCLDRASRGARAKALAPYLGIAAAYLALYGRAGYGSNGSGVYLNPMAEPVLFLSRLPGHWLTLLLAQFGGPPADLWILYPRALAATALVLAVSVLGLVGLLFWPLLRSRKEARFWAVGMALATIPSCATFPSDRLLVFAGVGAMGLIAMFFAAVYDLDPRQDGPRPAGSHPGLVRAAAAILLVFHLVAAPLLLPARSLTVVALRSIFQRVDRGVPATEDTRARTLVVPALPADGMVAYLPITREALGVPRPKRLRILATGLGRFEVQRTDVSTLVIRSDQGFYGSSLSQMMRGPSRPMRPGHAVALSDINVLVRQVTSDGRPQEVEFRFAKPLEDESFLWRCWAGSALVPCDPPAVGTSLDLAVGM